MTEEPHYTIEADECDPRIARVTYAFAQPDSRPALSLEDATNYVIAAISDGPQNDLKRAFETVDQMRGPHFRRILEAAMSTDEVSAAFRDGFHLMWTVNGFRYREELADDDLLIRAFRAIFPPFTGDVLTLYRGERASELEAGRLGLNWSTDVEQARVFARGLCCTYGCEGVLLSATANPGAILTGPNSHSANWLREMEHVVDPRLLSRVTEIQRFPAFT